MMSSTRDCSMALRTSLNVVLVIWLPSPSPLNHLRLLGDGLKHAASVAEKLNVSRLGVAGDFIKPSDGSRRQCRLEGAIGGEDNFHLDRDRILAPLDPPFAPFSSLHRGIARWVLRQHNSSAAPAGQARAGEPHVAP